MAQGHVAPQVDGPGTVEQITTGPGNKEDPDWGPDDRHLVFTLTRDHKSDVYMIDVFDRELTRITSGTALPSGLVTDSAPN